MIGFNETIGIPSVNSVSNTSISDVIGNKSDTGVGTSIAGKSNSIEKHIHSVGRVYPTLANAIAVAGGAGAWALSASWVEIIPASTITMAFDIHFVNIESASADDTYELALASGTAGNEVEIGRIRFVRDSVGGSKVVQSVPFLSPVVSPNSRISAKLASSSGGDSANISIQYHTY